MRKRFVFALALVLAACGQKEARHEQKHAEGADIVPAFPTAPPQAPGERAPVPPPPTGGLRTLQEDSIPDPPPYLPLYPGAHVLGGYGHGTGRIHETQLIFETQAPPGAVIAFYEKTTTQAAFVQTTNNANGATITFAATAGRRQIEVTAEPIANGSRVQMFWTSGE